MLMQAAFGPQAAGSHY